MAGGRRGSLRRVGGATARIAGARGAWTRREGLLLRVEDGALAGVGEASPLPGYSPDGLDDAERDLRRWIDEGCDGDVDAIPSPSARFAAETALLDLEGQREDEPLWRLLGGGESPAPVAVQGLILPGGEDETAERAHALFDAGLRTFKMKVGPEAAAERRRLERLRLEFGDRVRLRLDANRSLSTDAATATLEAWSHFDVQWIEEPCSEPGPAESPIPLAFDETLQAAPAASSVSSASSASLPGEAVWKRIRPWVENGTYAALVLKPTVLGLSVCRQLARRGREAGLDVVVSHCFEGPVAHQACAHLALALEPTPGYAPTCGLAKHAGLDAWPAPDGALVTTTRVQPLRRVRSGLGLDGDALWRALDPDRS